MGAPACPGRFYFPHAAQRISALGLGLLPARHAFAALLRSCAWLVTRVANALALLELSLILQVNARLVATSRTDRYRIAIMLANCDGEKII